jgi:hypothetical protein
MLADSHKSNDPDGAQITLLLQTIMLSFGVEYHCIESTHEISFMNCTFNKLLEQDALHICTYSSLDCNKDTKLAFSRVITNTSKAIMENRKKMHKEIVQWSVDLKKSCTTEINRILSRGEVVALETPSSPIPASLSHNHVNNHVNKQHGFNKQQGFQIKKQIKFDPPASINNLKQIKCEPPANINDLKRPLKFLPCSKPTARIYPKFILNDSQRNTFKISMTVSKQDDISNSSFLQPEDNIKISIGLCTMYNVFSSFENEQKMILQEVEAQTLSNFLSQQFSNLIEIKALKSSIKFLARSCIDFEENTKDADVKPRQRMAVIDEMQQDEKTFQKWCDPAGLVNAETNDILASFMHWTWHVTQGYLLVSAMRGVADFQNNSTQFLMADPVIFCQDTSRFCSTNCSEFGMQLFFKLHSCNNICKSLKLHPYK